MCGRVGRVRQVVSINEVFESSFISNQIYVGDVEVTCSCVPQDAVGNNAGVLATRYFIVT